jgi:hypothetical protein
VAETDQELAARIRTALAGDPVLPAPGSEVEEHQGVVHSTGGLESQDEVSRAATGPLARGRIAPRTLDEPRPPEPAILFGEGEAADVLDVGPVTLRRWLAAGRLPGARRGEDGRWIVPVADLRRAIENGDVRYPGSAGQRLAYVLRTPTAGSAGRGPGLLARLSRRVARLLRGVARPSRRQTRSGARPRVGGKP